MEIKFFKITRILDLGLDDEPETIEEPVFFPPMPSISPEEMNEMIKKYLEDWDKYFPPVAPINPYPMNPTPYAPWDQPYERRPWTTGTPLPNPDWYPVIGDPIKITQPISPQEFRYWYGKTKTTNDCEIIENPQYGTTTDNIINYNAKQLQLCTKTNMILNASTSPIR